MQHYEIKRRFVLDDDGAHIAIRKTVAGIVIQSLVEAEASFSVHAADDWVMVSLPPDGDIDGLAQTIHDAETGASVPVRDDDGDALKTAIERFAAYLCDETGMRLLAAEGLHDDSLADWHNTGFTETEFRESIACLALGTLFAKFQEIVAPVLDGQNAGEPGNLERDDPNDGALYILREGADGVWIRIKSIDARIYPTDEGVVADLYPAHQSDTTPVASTYAFFAECECD